MPSQNLKSITIKFIFSTCLSLQYRAEHHGYHHGQNKNNDHHGCKNALCFLISHIYHNHFDQVREQLSHTPYELPQMRINPEVKDINDFKYEDFELVNYKSYDAIKGQVAV